MQVEIAQRLELGGQANSHWKVSSQVHACGKQTNFQGNEYSNYVQIVCTIGFPPLLKSTKFSNISVSWFPNEWHFHFAFIKAEKKICV